jgi:hypothetical protein
MDQQLKYRFIGLDLAGLWELPFDLSPRTRGQSNTDYSTDFGSEAGRSKLEWLTFG